MTADAAAGRAVRARTRRADLPDLGADLRVQPVLRALPVVLRPARPARADHRGVQGGHRRAAADAGLLRQHRRRRADRAAGLLGAGRLRDRAPGRREVLHQRRADRPRRSRPGWPPATTSTCRSRSTARPRRSTTRSAAPGRTRRRCGRWRTSPTPASAASRSRSSAPGTTSASSTTSRRSPTRYGAQLRLTRLRPSGRGADVWDELHPHRGAAAASSTTGWSPTARAC